MDDLPEPVASAEGAIVWTPDFARVAASAHARFAESLRRRGAIDADEYRTVWQWSIEHPDDFWSAVADDAGIEWKSPPTAVLGDAAMPGATWFPGGTLNYVDLALRRRDDGPAVIFEQEDGNGGTLSWNELAEQVRLAAAGLRRLGVGTGDRVAAYVPSRVETVVAFLATASLGAICTATSPDFGERSVLDRFQQGDALRLLADTATTWRATTHPS